MKSRIILTSAALAALSTLATADVVVLKNGDTLNGTIGLVTSKTLKFKSSVLPEITINLSNIERYEITSEARVQPRGEPAITGKVSGDGDSVKVDDRAYPNSQIKAINPPAQEWTGAAVANFSLSRGNTNSLTIGAQIDAQLRRDDAYYNDRTTLAGAYNFGQSGGGAGGDGIVTDVDNWQANAQHDRFWTDQLYGYVNGKLEHDRIALLYYRFTPGIGLGYQWIESGTQNFSTETGVSYVREVYDDNSENDYASLRLAYHYDRVLTNTVNLFHNLEYLPAFDDPGDYTLNTDLGLRFAITSNFFSQFKVQYKRDSTPAEGQLKNDLIYTIGVGWQF